MTVKNKESSDYVIEFIGDRDNVVRISVTNGKTHVYALTRVAEFIIKNNVREIRILKCKNYVCDEVITKIKVIGID